MKNKWEVINECDDEEGNHTCWSMKIDHEKYGRFVWCTLNSTGKYNIEANSDGFYKTLCQCKTLTSAKRWVTSNIL